MCCSATRCLQCCPFVSLGNPWFLRPVDENRGPLGTTTSVLRISDLAVWQGVQVQQTTCKISAKPLDMTAIWWWVSLKYWNVVWYLQHCSAVSSIEQNPMKSDSTNELCATQYATSRGLWITACIQHGELRRTDQRNCWPRTCWERSPELTMEVGFWLSYTHFE